MTIISKYWSVLNIFNTLIFQRTNPIICTKVNRMCCNAHSRGFEKGSSGVYNQPGISGMISEIFLQLNKFSKKQNIFVRTHRTFPADGHGTAWLAFSFVLSCTSFLY